VLVSRVEHPATTVTYLEQVFLYHDNLQRTLCSILQEAESVGRGLKQVQSPTHFIPVEYRHATSVSSGVPTPVRHQPPHFGEVFTY
jgi:hypothetical protein